MFKKTITFIITSLLLSSCGPGHKGSGASKTVKGIGNVLQKGQVSLTDGELGIATRICEAFRSKRSNFLLYNRVGKRYEFTKNIHNCLEQDLSNTINPRLLQKDSGTKFIYEVSSESKYTVQTHDRGYIKSICEKLLIGNNDINTIIDDAGEIYEVEFAQGSMDYFLIYKASPLNSIDYQVYERIKYEVDTTSSTDNLKYGIVKKMTKTSNCNNDEDVQFIEELVFSDLEP
jgi:hypothetical protein